MSNKNRALLQQVKDLAARFQADCIAIRRHLHAHPELSYNEHQTAAFIAEQLQRWGIAHERAAHTGVIAWVGTGKEAGGLALRSDHDALPIEERNVCDYKSLHPGVAHLCGHDAHTACNLTAARILHALKDEFEGRICFLFQPGEERVQRDNYGGASMIMESEVFRRLAPRAVVAQHVNPEVPAGKIALKSGGTMASVDTVHLRVIGRGGHAAQPHRCVDPVAVSAQIIVGLQQIVSRMSNPVYPTVLTFGKISGGEAFNVIPNEVELLGTLRAYNEDWRRELYGRIAHVAKSIAEAYGAEVLCQIKMGPPALYNDEALTAQVESAAVEYLGREHVLPVEPYMTGEDFAFYTQQTPGCFYWLGVRNDAKGITSGLHADTMNLDEDALEVGSGLFAYLALKTAE